MLMRAICLTVWLGSMAGICADTITTREGQNLQGQIVLGADGTLRIGKTKVALKDLKQAKFGMPQSSEPATGEAKGELKELTTGLWALKQGGALSWDGSFIARKVVAMDDTKVSFEGAPKELFLSTVWTAAVFFGKVSLAHAFKLREQQKPGVLLASGDFVEGSLKSVANGTLSVDSVLFGRKSYAVGVEAVALWLQKPQPIAEHFTLYTRDGSMLLVKQLAFKDDGVVLNGSPFNNYRIARDDLVEIRNGGAADVLTLAWAKVDNAAPEKKLMLLTKVENVGQILQLRQQVQVHEVKLQEAVKLLTKAEAARTGSTAQRQKVMQDWRRLQDVWRQKIRDYSKIHQNKTRLAGKARQEQMAVARAERALGTSKHTLDKYTVKLGILEKAAKENPEKDMRRNRDSFVRSIKKVKKDIQRAQKKLDGARRDNNKIQAETKLLPAEEKSAKQTVDQAKKDADQAMQAYRKSIADYQATSRQAGIARGKVAELQQAKDQATQELEKLRSKTPALPSNK